MTTTPDEQPDPQPDPDDDNEIAQQHQRQLDDVDAQTRARLYAAWRRGSRERRELHWAFHGGPCDCPGIG